MQTNISETYQQTPLGQQANDILRSCVHCGFCNATCPTYQLLGDELDGPRGRIYLIKQILEGNPATEKTKQHLDRCLNCLNCETTCPSGVQYHHLLEIGQSLATKTVTLAWHKRLLRQAILTIMPYPKRFQLFVNIGLFFKFLLPASLAKLLPKDHQQTIFFSAELKQKSKQQSKQRAQRKILLLQGCVHNAISPDIHQKTAQVLDKLGIEVLNEVDPGCCGALSHHIQAESKTVQSIKHNIDAWSQAIEQGVEAIISNASGCGVMVKDYPRLVEKLLGKDSSYYLRAVKIAAMTQDVSEVLANEDLSVLQLGTEYKNIAYHPPCSLQHGQHLPEIVEQILASMGATLLPVQDKHLCCGSAGSYSLFNPEISEQLKENKLENLQKQGADVIATANIGCLHHLQTDAKIPVKHWLQLIQ
ncbi:glycolate oxidase subunit GlcF [sulfur-oxidizing endosymbiont of Gigantopelta aegis]|uniref:glycolate oxidase subunit GlcF n=1 Tax=sulfur-oxidizing endosymbiont of Gigantopelta aegis TaxID=2794934 RepID=UPI0018DD6924|nr:glycolate oxidase subunit GlcF [sulfur-oxidizing endosymbiont of Gigantopelta aegis]